MSPEPSTTKEVERQSSEIPKAFWWACGHEALDQDWNTGDFSTYIDRRLRWQAFGVEFDRIDIAAMLAPESDANDDHTSDAKADTAVDDRRLPSEADIAAKMKELIALKMTRDIAAQVIRQIAGFEGVGNEHARRTVSGQLPRGRPVKNA